MTLAVGTRLGVYEVTGLLGVGGMGEVVMERGEQLRDFIRRYQFVSEDMMILMPIESRAGLTWERVKWRRPRRLALRSQLALPLAVRSARR
jgi:hypothetical protein